MNLLFKPIKWLLTSSLLLSISLLSGCSNLVVLDPKGPVAGIQKDLILLSIFFMLFIIIVVYILFTIIVVKYRERKEQSDYEPPEQEGSTLLEIIWTAIPILIVIALSIPTVKAIYALDKAPVESADKEPLVIHATSVNWKWIFSYPEENIETVNYINIPSDRPILFKLTSADSMTSFWVPALGGQKYAMAGMQNELFLEADKPGVFEGRNANFNGEGFNDQVFRVKALTDENYEDWVKGIQEEAPKLSLKQYDKLMLTGHSKAKTFSSTHLRWVDHAKDAEYATNVRERLGESTSHNKTSKEKPNKVQNNENKHSQHD
ncbi:cytochrome aa3 quinol oxidase subunit II [Fictibacillus aquaticus]|uniref:Quinol oxidase subunit 2 n=1 Tax=Fictibacillus aquaticus TaxID=2021314 RepID=A0A235F3Z2_9BACL|nr:cytochrome aa3 quinol oxidase subunit II [Fictibacillus aquaticus]OYD55991.1 cytochrome aa3 quinol oxidase subunit II [Fictibacillus aquaticus]